MTTCVFDMIFTLLGSLRGETNFQPFEMLWIMYKLYCYFKTRLGMRSAGIWCQRVHHPLRPPPCGALKKKNVAEHNPARNYVSYHNIIGENYLEIYKHDFSETFVMSILWFKLYPIRPEW